jgi:hypothetical protein
MTKSNTNINLFYGPGGVGKTLSVFKYATCPEHKGKKNLFVTNDTYHVGARGKFRTFCDLIGSDCRSFEAEVVDEIQDELEKYDELYFDLMFGTEEPVLKIISSLTGSFAVKKVFVVNMLMLLDDNLLNYYSGSAGHPDEYIVTFMDQISLLANKNQELIRTRLNELAHNSPLWISDGQSVPENLYPYKEAV